MELFERYILEVGTYLPQDLRDNVTEELRSNLRKALADRRLTDTSASQEDLEVAVLQELGPPHQYADAYVPRPRVLFGPRLYPAFFRTLKIAIAVLVALAALGVYFDFARSQSLLSLGPSLLTAFTSILTGSLVVVGIAVVVFALIERQTGAPPEADEKWDPRTLPEAEDPDKISLGDQVSSIAFLVVALLVVNLFQRSHWRAFHLQRGERLGAVVGPGLRCPSLAAQPGSGPGSARQLHRPGAMALVVASSHRQLRRQLSVCGVAGATWSRSPPLIAADPAMDGPERMVARTPPPSIRSSSPAISPVWIDRNVSLVFWAACLGLAYSLFKLVRRMIARP